MINNEINAIKDRICLTVMPKRIYLFGSFEKDTYNEYSDYDFYVVVPKDSVKDNIKEAAEFIRVKAIVDDYIDYYNNDRYQWQLAKLSPNEYCQFCITGEYPLAVANPPSAPIAEKNPQEPGKKRGSDSRTGTKPGDSTLNVRHPGCP